MICLFFYRIASQTVEDEWNMFCVHVTGTTRTSALKAGNRPRALSDGNVSYDGLIKQNKPFK